MNEVLKKIDEMVFQNAKMISVSGATYALLGDVRRTIRSFQIQEPCGWCSKWKLEFNAIDDEGNTITTDRHMVMGGIADYCPVCGRYLNQPQEGE